VIRATFETGGKAVVGLAAGTEYPAVKFDLAETFHRKCLPFAFSDGNQLATSGVATPAAATAPAPAVASDRKRRRP